MKKIAKLFADNISTPLKFNLPLAAYNTYKIGGPAEFLLETSATEEIVKAIKITSSEHIPLTILGAGSNVLIPDEGLEGLVLRIYNKNLKPVISGDIIYCNAGVIDETLAWFAMENSISGFEFLYDIPGTIGGGLVQNAANNDGQICEDLIDIAFANAQGEVMVLPKEKLAFGYRTSYFKENRTIILSARFQLKRHALKEEIKSKMEAIRKTRWEKFPMEFPNCGSVFKRPPGNYAGKLIQDAGLSGLRVGDAMVSSKHRNFIVNLGQATANDIKTLIAEVQKRVAERFGIMLECELIYLETLKEG